MDRGICCAIVHRVAKSLTGLKQLSMHPPFQRIGSLIAEERDFFFPSLMCMQLGFPGGSVGKETTFIALDARDACLIPWLGKIPWRRAWKPTPVSLPLSIVDKGLQCMGSQSVGQNWSNWACTHVHVTRKDHMRTQKTTVWKPENKLSPESSCAVTLIVHF